jgi:hypothetical protein
MTDKLRITKVVVKFFSVTNYIMEWYAEASEDQVLSTEELVQLGAGVCRILGLKTDIELSKE